MILLQKGSPRTNGLAAVAARSPSADQIDISAGGNIKAMGLPCSLTAKAAPIRICDQRGAAQGTFNQRMKHSRQALREQ